MSKVKKSSALHKIVVVENLWQYTYYRFLVAMEKCIKRGAPISGPYLAFLMGVPRSRLYILLQRNPELSRLLFKAQKLFGRTNFSVMHRAQTSELNKSR